MGEPKKIKNNPQIHSAYDGFDLLIAILLVIACIFFRPMILGNNYSSIGFLIFLLIIVLVLGRQHGKILISKNTHTRTYFTTMLLSTYCFFQCILLHSDQMRVGIQTCFLLSVAVTAFYLGFNNKKIEALFIRLIYFLLIGFVVSYAISFICASIYGWDKIQIASFDYGYFTNTNLYFPFTTTYGALPYKGIELKRLLGFAKESGIMQIFYIWAFFSANKHFDSYRLIRVLMVLGVIECLSTTGFIVFGGSLLLYFDIKKVLSKNGIITIVLIGFVVYILIYAEGVRIVDRAVATITDRTNGISYGLSVFLEKPIFGGGFYSTLGDESIQTGICAIASLGQIGIVGISLWLMIFFFSFIDCNNKKRFLYTNAALFATALFAQPLLFAPVMYWFLLIDYDKEKIYLYKKSKVITGVDRNENCSYYANQA